MFDKVPSSIEHLSNSHRTTSNSIFNRTNRTNQDIFAVNFDYCSITVRIRTAIIRLSSIEFDDLITKISSIKFG